MDQAGFEPALKLLQFALVLSLCVAPSRHRHRSRVPTTPLTH